jgi:hypothetical protein
VQTIAAKRILMKNHLTLIFAQAKRIVLAMVLLLCCMGSSFAQDNKGKEFWLCFPGNQISMPTELYITSESAATVTVEVPGLGFSRMIKVPANSLRIIKLPEEVQVQSKFIAENKGVHVTATKPVVVYGMNAVTSSTDAFLAYPMETLGKEYFVLGYSKDHNYSLPTQATIIATDDQTTVTILSSITDGGFKAGEAKQVVLQKGQVYQMRSLVDGADYTGTKISADKPISVFGGAQCTNLSDGIRACDHLVEQMPPVSTWGKTFITVPLSTRLKGDLFRVMAQQDGTQVNINGTTVATLDAGKFYETLLPSESYNSIIASKPVLVGQYSRSSQADNTLSDPFFVLVSPTEQYQQNFVISAGTDHISNNFINITSTGDNLQNIRVDDQPLNTAGWHAVAGTNYFGIQVPVSTGMHVITSSQPVGLLVYGFGKYDSYGYLGGQAMQPLTINNGVVLTPDVCSQTITQQQCFTATVKNASGALVQGQKVDFTVSGANNAIKGSAFTDSNGVAEFCYTGLRPGNDKITAATAESNDASILLWKDTCRLAISATATDPVCNAAADGSIQLAVSNAAAPVRYLWSTGSTTKDISGLKAGTYTVRATDRNGCSDSSSIVLKDPPPIRTFAVITPNPTVAEHARSTIYLGYGAQKVDLTLRVFGGVPPYTFNWGSNGTTQTISVSPKVSSTYNCIIKDSRGCTKLVAFKINVIDVRCGSNNEKVLLCNKLANGAGTETICVDSSAVAGYLAGGAVLGGCELMSAPVYNAGNANSRLGRGQVGVFPNPAGHYLDVSWKLPANNTQVQLNILDTRGNLVMSVPSANIFRRRIDISRLGNGLYLLQVVGNQQASSSTRFVIIK